jgi:glycosyltransferase involved in cell wall biosynthesis
VARPVTVVVVIPARDEETTVGAVVRGVRAALPDAPVVVVDDASRDDTAARAKDAGAHVTRLARHHGYSGALIAGYRAALAMNPTAIAQLDADGQHDPADLPRLVAASAAQDLVIGSRFLTAGSYRVPPARRAAIQACRWMGTLAGGPDLTDPTSGYRVLRADIASDLAAVGFPRGLTETSLLVELARRGARIAEVPVRMRASRGRSMHDGLAGGVRFVRISLAMAELATRSATR